MQKYTWGVVFYGEFKNDIANGEGAVVDENGETIAEGVFVNEWILHKGKYSIIKYLGGFLGSAGSIYEGDIQDGQPHGKGKLNRRNGDKYEG